MSDLELKTAIIGTGFGSVVQFPAFNNHPNFTPHSLVGKHQSKTEKIGRKLGIGHTTTNWREVLTNDEIQVVSIATPPHLHEEMAIASLEAGKHVLCEKPLAMNTSQAENMLMVAEESGLVAMIDLEFRYLPSKLHFLELIKNQYIGDIYQFDISINTPSRLNPRRRGYNWWSEARYGGGILHALGSHYIDYINLIFGEIKAVVGRTAIHIPKRLNKLTGKMQNVTADDSFSCLLDIGDNIHCSLSISSTSSFGKGATIEAHGSKGALVLSANNTIYGGKIGEDKKLKKIPIPPSYPQDRKNGDHYLVSPLTRLLHDFVNGVISGSSPRPNFEDGLNVQRCLDAIVESHEKRKWIDLK